MDNLHPAGSTQPLGRMSRFLIFISHTMLCLYGCLFFLESLLGFNARIIPMLRFGSALIAVVVMLFEGKIVLRLNRFFLWYLGIIAISFISNLYTVADNGMNVSINIFETAIVAIAFYSTLRDKACIKQFLFLLACSGGVLFVVLLTNEVLHIDNRLGSTLTGGNTNNFAEYVMITFFAAVITVIVAKRKSTKIIALIMCVLELYMLFLSGGRKYILCPAIMIVIFAWRKMNTISLAKKILLLVGVVLGFAVLWNIMMTNEVLYESIGKRFEADSMEAGAGNRFELFANGVYFFIRSPILGHGENAYTELNSAVFGINMYSHNTYVELLTNLGLVGFLLYYIPYFKTIMALRKASRKRTKDNLAFLFCAFMLATLFLHAGIIAYMSATLLTQLVAIGFRLVELEQQEINLTAEEKVSDPATVRNVNTHITIPADIR